MRRCDRGLERRGKAMIGVARRVDGRTLLPTNAMVGIVPGSLNTFFTCVDCVLSFSRSLFAIVMQEREQGRRGRLGAPARASLLHFETTGGW